VKCCAAVRGSECHCGACHRTFTGLTLFEAHQDVDHTRTPPVVCRDPASQGLAQDDRGTWGTAEGLKARDSLRGRLAAARSERPGEAA
jgi:hypothetical protein